MNPQACSPTQAVVEEIRSRLAGRGAPLLVALDGGSGAGKSTLAATLAAELGASVVESDDFYVGAWARRRRRRHNAREGADEEWHATWDVAETYYFTSVRPPESFDVVVEGDWGACP